MEIKCDVMESICLQLQHENWAYQNGYSNEKQVSLVADFLNGMYSSVNNKDLSFTELPLGIHISKPMREAFYRSGKELANLKSDIEDSDIKTALSNLFLKFHKEFTLAFAKGSILASTGDCRNVCEYHTGNRTEYFHNGW